jgi:LCP family protein required for cell wall assembly
MPASSDGSVRVFAGRLGIALVVSTVLMTAGVVAVNRTINSKVGDIERVQLNVTAAPPEGANFLIIGSDSREFARNNQTAADAFGSPDTQSGLNTDTLMVAHVEPNARRTVVVSFPRDLLVRPPGGSSPQMINSIYADGGAQAVIDMLGENFGIPINHYLEVDMQTFESVVDAIGNVKVYFPFAARDLYTGLNARYPDACYPLDGANALAYVRSRHLQYKNPETGAWENATPTNNDLDRIARQQAFIRKLAGLAVTKSLGDPFLALDIANRVLHYLTADQALTRGDVNSLIKAFRTINTNDENALRFVTVPVRSATQDPNRLELDRPAADLVFAVLRDFGDDQPAPSTVQPHEVQVRVLDGTGKGEGEAARVAATLGDYGFRSGGTGVDPRGRVPVTEIRYPAARAQEAYALSEWVDDARLVVDETIRHGVVLVAGGSFDGLTVPAGATTTTAAPAVGETGPMSAPTTTTTAPRVTTTTTLPPDDCA